MDMVNIFLKLLVDHTCRVQELQKKKNNSRRITVQRFTISIIEIILTDAGFERGFRRNKDISKLTRLAGNKLI